MPIQFSVTRIDKDYYHIVVQTEKEVVRSYDMHKLRMIDHLKDEMSKLEPLGKSDL